MPQHKYISSSGRGVRLKDDQIYVYIKSLIFIRFKFFLVMIAIMFLLCTVKLKSLNPYNPFLLCRRLCCNDHSASTLKFSSTASSPSSHTQVKAAQLAGGRAGRQLRRYSSRPRHSGSQLQGVNSRGHQG